jgi:hypothetical protein
VESERLNWRQHSLYIWCGSLTCVCLDERQEDKAPTWTFTFYRQAFEHSYQHWKKSKALLVVGSLSAPARDQKNLIFCHHEPDTVIHGDASSHVYGSFLHACFAHCPNGTLPSISAAVSDAAVDFSLWSTSRLQCVWVSSQWCYFPTIRWWTTSPVSDDISSW